MKGRRNFHVRTARYLIAACLWDCGEDALADRALAMTPDEHAAIQRIEAVYEGSLRPLAQARRRPEKLRPARFNAESQGGAPT
jgi:hypothetical protein